jgi:CheY-like chemotaxis protein
LGQSALGKSFEKQTTASTLTERPRTQVEMGPRRVRQRAHREKLSITAEDDRAIHARCGTCVPSQSPPSATKRIIVTSTTTMRTMAIQRSRRRVAWSSSLATARSGPSSSAQRANGAPDGFAASMIMLLAARAPAAGVVQGDMVPFSRSNACPISMSATSSRDRDGTPRRIPERLLVVEDNERLRAMLAQVLGECAAEVRGVASVAEAGALIRTWRPDAVVLDFTLPDGYGLDVLRLIADSGPMPVVVAISGAAEPGETFRLRRHGYRRSCPRCSSDTPSAST